MPATLVATQFGESFSRHVAAAPLVFDSCADQLPLCPPATRASTTPAPEPETFQPEVSVSNELFLTIPALTVTWLVAVLDWPTVSVTVTATVNVPADAYVCA